MSNGRSGTYKSIILQEKKVGFMLIQIEDEIGLGFMEIGRLKAISEFSVLEDNSP